MHVGSLASSIFDPYTILVGASGGVYALFTAQLANVILVSAEFLRIVGYLRRYFIELYNSIFNFTYFETEW